MNEQAILDAYNLFVQNGYKKSVDDFKKLISSNPEALTDSYNLFVGQGYKKSIDDYKALMGLSAQAAQPAEPVTDKKKVATGLSSEDGSLDLQKIKPERAVADATFVKPQMLGPAPKKEQEKTGYLKTLYDNLALGASYVNEAVVSLPETVINLLAVPQNFIAEKTGWNIGTNADQIKNQLGIKNPLLDWVQESQKVIKGEVAKDIADRYNDPGIVSNFQKGNYQAGFELLGAGIANSAPISVAMMYGGAVAAPETIMALTTLGLTEAQRKELEEMDPTMKESEKMMKAVSMAGAESVFEALGSRTIGMAYRDIAAKEGKEAAKDILKNGLVTTYKKALEKTGPVAGFAGEGIEEAATQITQNVISGRPTFEGVADAFATGAGAGVVYTSPMTAIKAKKYIDNKVQTYQTKEKIGEILKDKADNIDKLYNVPVSSEVTPEQLEVANLPKSRDILVTNLKKAVTNNTITEDDAKQSLFVFDKIQQVSSSLKDLDVTKDDKAKIATLLRQRDELNTKIQNKDDVLVVQEKQQIQDINRQIQEIITKPKEDAIQEQAAGEVPVQPTTGISEEVEEGKPEPKPEGVTAEGIKEEVAPEVPQEKVKPIDFSKQLEEKYGVTVDLLGSLDRGNLSLSRIIVPEEQRATGIGTQVMEDIINYADENKVKVTLTPSIDFGGESVERLTDFYKRFGFVENKGDNKDFTIKDTMYREPQVSLKTQEEVGIPEALLTIDTTDKTNLQKVYDFLDKLDTDLDKFSRETAGMNLAVPVVKAIIKSVKALVATGITLQEAIRRAAVENKVSEQDVVDSIKSFTEQRAMQAKPEGVTEMELPGFNRMVGELEGVIEKSRERGAEEQQAMDNAIAYLQGSRVYEDASDTQREQMVRNVRKMFGKREKAAPKPEKLFGEVKDVKQITMSEYELLKKQLRDTAKGARNAISLWRKTANALTSYLKKMVDGGHISMKQSASVLRKFSGVNLFDEKSIGKFVDYMERVFKNAAYVEQIEKINSMLPTAKKNLVSKLGVSESLIPLLSKLFAINPTLIPDSVFGKYTELVEMIGQRKAVLELKEYGKVLDTTEEILDAVDEETLKAETLAEVFDSFEKKVLDDDGKVNFAETLKRMLDDGIIKQDDAEIMRKYKSMIVPRETREKKSEEELAAEKEVLVEAVKEAEIDSDGLAMKDERDQARELQKLIKTDAVERLDNATLNNLLRVIDNINNGYFPHYGELMVERLNAINKSGVLEKVTETAEPYKIEEVYAKLKSMVTDKDKFSELVRRKPLYYMEQAYGNFDSKAIFESLLEQSAQAQAAYVSDEKNISSKLEKAEEEVAKSLNQNPNKTLESKFKMMTYMIQLEHDSNPGSKQVNQAKDFLEATIKHIKNARSTFGERDAKFLEKILNNKSYQDADGQIDADKLYKTFNHAEKKAIKVMQDINADMRDKAIYTASVIRGNKIKPLNNYIHLNVLHEYKPEESLIGASFVEDYNRSLRPSTRAKSLIERTGDVSALNFDVFASVARGSKYVLMDYYLTEPVRTARKTINETRKRIEEKRAERDKQQKENPISEKAKDKQDKADEIQRDVLNSMDNAYEEAVDNVLASNFTDTSFFDKVANYMSKQGYRAVLASLPRFAAELSSNLSFVAIAAPKQMSLGIKNRDVVMSADMPMIMKNVKSTEINRLFPHDTLSGRLVDTSILEQASGIKGGRAKNDVANKIQQIYNLSLKKYLNPIELMADAIVSSPDKMVMRPLWYGTFLDTFKKESGKDLDEKKAAQNDEKYMSANKEALDAARKEADRMSILAGATDNAFLGVLKGRDKQNQSVGLKLFNTFNNFMTNFLIYEYTTARIGLMAAMGNGSITKKQGYALMAAVATRMTLYSLLIGILGSAMLNLFVDDEDADDEKTLLQKIGQAMASSMTSIFLGRDFGNATKAVINQGVEYGNEKFLDFLREGEYDPYKDAIQYTIMPPERKGKKAAFEDMIMNMMGPFGPSVKTAAFAFEKATEAPKKEAAAIQRSEKEKQIRLPLEILGNLGMIPLYKDVRKIVNKEIYKDLDNAEKKPVMNKIGKEDMKRYFPQMYNELYGPGGSLYDVELIQKEMRKEKERLTREMKDEMYNYTPKRK